MKTQQIWKCGFLVVMVLGSILTACTKYDTPMEVEEEGKTASRASIESMCFGLISMVLEEEIWQKMLFPRMEQ